MMLLIRLFPEKQIDPEALYEVLKDLDDKAFEKGFKTLINESIKIDASTNIVAIIRENAKSTRAFRDTTPDWMKELITTKKLIVKGE